MDAQRYGEPSDMRSQTYWADTGIGNSSAKCKPAWHHYQGQVRYAQTSCREHRVLTQSATDDGLSDDVGMDNNMPLMLASPELGNLQEVEQVIRMANSSPGGRDALTKYIVGADYVTKLVPLVEIAEEFESLADLHRLCNIMKMLILLNDTAIIEHAVSDDVVMGVVGALECKAEPHVACLTLWLTSRHR